MNVKVKSSLYKKYMFFVILVSELGFSILAKCFGKACLKSSAKADVNHSS